MRNILSYLFNGSLVAGIENPTLLFFIAVNIQFIILIIWFCRWWRRYESPINLFIEAPRRSMTDEICAICQDRLSVTSLETSCRHKFCGQCILCLLDKSNEAEPLICPLCRQKVNKIVPLWSNDLELTQSEKHVKRVVDLYNFRFGNEPRPIHFYLEDFPYILRCFARKVVTLNGLICIRNLRFAFMLFVWMLYLLSPTDFLPEAIFGLIGIIDDILLSAIMFIRYRQLEEEMNT